MPCGSGLTAMIDSGAQVSVMSLAVYKLMQVATRQISQLTPTRVRPRSVTGSSLSVVGRCALELPGLPLHRYLVCRDLPYPVLLGADFCLKHRVLLDFPNKRAQIQGEWVDAVNIGGGEADRI